MVGLLVCGFHIDVSASEPAADDSFTKQELIEHFIGTAFGAEYFESFSDDADAGTLKRWEKPLRVLTIASQEDGKVLFEKLNEISKLTGVQWRPIGLESPETFNYLVAIADRNELREVLTGLAKRRQHVRQFVDLIFKGFYEKARFICLGWVEFNQKTELYFAFVLVESPAPSGLPGPVVSVADCLEEELAQSMGLANDFPNKPGTVFSDDPLQVQRQLTEIDKAALRLLYHPKLQAGMTESEVRRTLDRILED
ncbi:MAG: DUF2927 domain-containing protein [Alphaproteobacteria bacterium]|nr:DUF2927 domain-containing protein [Alphaproteobacteria bacterium]